MSGKSKEKSQMYAHPASCILHRVSYIMYPTAKAEWLDETDAESLRFIEPDANMTPERTSNAILRINE